MLKPSDPDYDPEIVAELYAILDEMLSPFGKKMTPAGLSLTGIWAPFDYTKPNQHDTKADFSREYKIVKTVFETSNTLLRSLVNKNVDQDRKDTLRDLEASIDRTLMQSAPSAPLDTTTDVIRRMVAETNGYTSSLWVVLDFHLAFKKRLGELEEQKDKFWNVPNRAPDYYARAIASRVAKIYARETGQRPTSGTSPVSGSPSTGFTRALEKIFKLLGIKCGARSPANWAIAHLTDEDLTPPQDTIGSVLGTDSAPKGGRGLLSSLFEDPES